MILFYFKKLQKLKRLLFFTLFQSYRFNDQNEIQEMHFLQGHNVSIKVDKAYLDSLLQHKFDVLGSGKIDFTYNAVVKGFENNHYRSTLEGLCDINGSPKCQRKFLKHLVNRTNYKSSLKLWECLFKLAPSYIPIDWARDIKSGYRWNTKLFYTKIKYDTTLNPPGADIKVPWELSRFQHLPYLLYAKQEKEIVMQVLDFIATQPPYFGPNWRCAMDVAIRAVNWIIVLSKIELPKNEKDKLLSIVNSSLQQHMDFIVQNLENSGSVNNNHYLADVSGLFILASYLGDEKYIDFAKVELIKEAFFQFDIDGINFEGSTCYHRLSAELIFYPLYFSAVNHPDFNGLNYRSLAEDIFSKGYVELVYKVFDSFRFLLKTNGHLPQLGDNDSGQFIKLYPRDSLDGRYLLALAAVFFDDHKFKVKDFFTTSEDSIEIVLLYGEQGKILWNQMRDSNLSDIGSKLYKSAGWFILRCNKNYCIGSVASLGQKGNGGHDHNDRLSYELVLDAKEAVVDLGSYCYSASPVKREYYRSVKNHNVGHIVNANGETQEQFTIVNIVKMSGEIQGEIKSFQEDENIIELMVQIQYVNRVYQRTFRLFKMKNQLSIVDNINIMQNESFMNVVNLSKGFELICKDKVREYKVNPSKHYGSYAQPIRQYKTPSQEYIIRRSCV